MRWPRQRRARESELSDELQAHLEMAIALRIERGESPSMARDNALREFGNVTHVAEVTREMWGGASWDAFIRDVRYAARGLRRSPSFTAVAVATFALGIGANTAMFTVVNGALLKPLPFAQPDRLVVLAHVPATFPAGLLSLLDKTYAELRATPSPAFSSVASFSGRLMTLTGVDAPERLRVSQVSANFTAILGVSPAIGRTFTAQEEADGNHVAVLSDQMWRERFGGARSVLGKSITLDGVPYMVIGVMPSTFDFPHGDALWTPLPPPNPQIGSFQPVIARLSPGTKVQAATRALQSALAHLPSAAGEKPNTWNTSVRPMTDLLVANAKSSLWIMSGAVSFVLLIACANVANLLLIRAATRRHEIGVRAALGAGRARIIRQLMTESALVACIGGAVGVVLAKWGVRVLVATAPVGLIPRSAEITVDWRVLGAAFGVSLLAGLVCGIFPALASTRRDPREALATSARTIAGSDDRIRRVFVVAQLALAIVLSTGAGLLIKSFARMRAVDLGFRSSDVVTFDASLPRAAFPNGVDLRTFEARVIDRLRQLPGVESASMVNAIPLGGPVIHGGLHIDGVNTIPREYGVDKVVAAPGYFSTMGIRLVAGRDFDSRDNHSSLPVTIVSRSVARKFWPPDGLGAIGQRLTEDEENPQPSDWRTIVGIVDDVAPRGATEGRHDAQYFPLAQSEDGASTVASSSDFIRNVTFVLRTVRTAQDLTPSFRAIVHELNPVVALRNIQSMDDAAARATAGSRFETQLLTIFAALALLLAAVGTYGVLAYDVAARTHELGVRVALGAVSGEVVRVVVRRTLALVIPGLLIGLIGALAVTRVLQKSLFEVTPTDPATLVAVSGVLLLVALIAGLAPTRRAMRIDPMTALRSE
jgi:putative ABC transport system permease protein